MHKNNLLLNANAINLTGAVQAGAKLNANAVQQLTVDSQAKLFGSDSIELSADAIQLDGYAGAENSITAISANNLESRQLLRSWKPTASTCITV